MSETITKKKKIDYILLRKLEDEYDEAVEDTDRKERHLIERVHSDYLKAENKGEFFEGLQKSDSWYYERFKEYEFPPDSGRISVASIQSHQERKVNSIVSDLEEMQKEIPILEVDEALRQGTNYVDPSEQKRDWIEQTKQELMSETPKAITEDSNFGKYQQTKQMLSKARDISKHDFDVSGKYRAILLHQLKKTIEYLNNILGEVKDERTEDN